MTIQELHAAVGPGDRVTIRNRFGQETTGRAVMFSVYGVTLNMGGKYGTPAVATPDNVVKILKAPKSEAARSVLL